MKSRRWANVRCKTCGYATYYEMKQKNETKNWKLWSFCNNVDCDNVVVARWDANIELAVYLDCEVLHHTPDEPKPFIIGECNSCGCKTGHELAELFKWAEWKCNGCKKELSCRTGNTLLRPIGFIPKIWPKPYTTSLKKKVVEKKIQKPGTVHLKCGRPECGKILKHDVADISEWDMVNTQCECFWNYSFQKTAGEKIWVSECEYVDIETMMDTTHPAHIARKKWAAKMTDTLIHGGHREIHPGNQPSDPNEPDDLITNLGTFRHDSIIFTLRRDKMEKTNIWIRLWNRFNAMDKMQLTIFAGVVALIFKEILGDKVSLDCIQRRLTNVIMALRGDVDLSTTKVIKPETKT